MTDSRLKDYLKICFEKPWHLDECIYQGDGAWGTHVYEIEDDEHNRCVLKCVPSPANRRENIRREAATMKSLSGTQGIARLNEFILLDDGDTCLLLMRMKKYTSLAEIMDDDDITFADVEKIVRDVLQGLAACHERGFVHRDIKPQNIFRDEHGDYMLGDFGITCMPDDNGCLTINSQDAYTPLYAAPEVCKGETKDWFRADIYSLGLVMYQLLNDGILPFGPCGQAELIKHRCSKTDVPPLQISNESVAAVVWKTLQYNPENRYANAKLMAEDFEKALSGDCPAYEEYMRSLSDTAYAMGEFEEAYKIYEACQSFDWAKRGLGLCLFNGSGVHQDVKRGVDMLLQCTQSDNSEAMYCIGTYYFNSDCRDYEKAAQYFRLSAEKGYAEAQFRLGYCLIEGLGVQADTTEAQKWFSRAAEQGHVGAKTYMPPEEKYWEIFDWMPADGGKAIQITRCRKIIDGVVNIPNRIDGKNVVSLGAYLFIDNRPEDESGDHKPSLYSETCDTLRQIELPANLAEIHPRALYGCVNLESVAVSEQNTSFKTVNGVLYTHDGKTLIKCPARAQEIDIPEGVENIEACALFGCINLTEIALPATLKRIGKAAFSGCSALEKLSISDGVESVGAEAFTFCENLEEISFPDSVHSIGDHILSWRYGTKVACPDGSAMKIYLSEYCPYDPKVGYAREDDSTIKEAIMQSVLLLAVAYERHPDGVPRESGSYRLVMEARRLLRATCTDVATKLALEVFASSYPGHVAELIKYWTEE